MPQDFTTLENQVLQQITPTATDEAHLQQTITQLKNQINTHLKKYGIPITPHLVGSTAKHTYLKNKLDIDLFLIFPQNTPKNLLATITRTIGTALLTNTEECYAEHPYIRGTYKKYKTEIVPCYDIQQATEKQSAVDRTPLHTIYIQNHLKNHQHPHVRLLKQFLYGIGCYGAEAEIEGFSGYLTELIILKYHTFHNTLTQAAQWTPGTTLTLTDTTPPPFTTPLIFIDPVDPERNVASALSIPKFNLFITACQHYQLTPNQKFFFPKPLKPLNLTQITHQLKKQKIIGIEFANPHIINENLYPQLRKTARSIQDTAELYGFTITDTTFYITKNHVGIVLIPEETTISSIIEHTGPPTNLTSNVKQFKDKWNNHPDTITPPYQHKNRWYVKIKRPYTHIENLIKDQLPKLPVGKHLEPIIHNKFTILNKKELLKENLTKFWTEYLDTRYPWER